MAVELTLILRFEGDYAPSDQDIEEALDCIVVEREAEEEV
jgi:hypothetical protein